MGGTYETDTIERRDVLALTIQVAAVIKPLARMIACTSWLQARLAMQAA